MKTEKIVKPLPGWVGILMMIVCITLGVVGLMNGYPLSYILFAVALFFLIGLVSVTHNEACVLIQFGRYKGTIKEHGFFWVSPMNNKKTVSLKPHSYTSDGVKVTDKFGSPITISLVLDWKVEDTFMATFNVDDYNRHVLYQCNIALIKIADCYPYDKINIDDQCVTLIAGGDTVNKHLEQELRERLEGAGISVMEARLSYVAYGSKSSKKANKKANGEKGNGTKKK